MIESIALQVIQLIGKETKSSNAIFLNLNHVKNGAINEKK
jgi:hypothetical protein